MEVILGFGKTVIPSGPKVVWSANRASPVRDNATIELTRHGDLVPRDADGSTVWSSGTSGKSVAGMEITKRGNLVMFDQKYAIVWQSFDHPTDSLVPGQSLMEGMRLTPNISATNSTKNQCYVTVLRDGLYGYVESTPPQLYFSYPPVKNNETVNGQTKVTFQNGSLSIIIQVQKKPYHVWSTQSTDLGLMADIMLPPSQFSQYIKLESDGHLRLHQWSDNENRWIESDVMEMMSGDCAYPTVCGEYGICTNGQCSCPHESNTNPNYFKPVDDRKANLGCKPLNPISCQDMQHHELLMLTDVSYSDQSHAIVNLTNRNDCKQACLKNCSCRAVMFRYGQEDSYGKCFWVTKVFSLQSIQPEAARYNSTAYLKVQLSPSNSSSAPTTNKRKFILAITLPTSILVLLLIAAILYLQRRRKYEDSDEDSELDHLSSGMPTRFSFEKLRECTEGFSKKLGGGGFGSVFEGKLDEERVAVKRLEGARQGKKEFLAEVETIGSIEHINLIKLIGFCVEKSQRLLVYEYMSRGSLDRWIYNCHNNAPFDWCTRCRIILDIAKGLCYLHEGCRRKIAHLDIKPQNILLDENFSAKVADFGLSKLIDRDQSKVVTMMRGTPGYLAPEWLTSQITEKVDVYSFGVVILEIISGRKSIDRSRPEENVHIIYLLQEKARNNQWIDLIENNSDDMVSRQEEVIQMMKLAMWCLQNDSSHRPSMSTVIKVLEGTISVEADIIQSFLNANSAMSVQDKPYPYSVREASILSGPR
ncbi:G-type lectin S-receptor-like serine/threonine-protein kinase SD2-5 [Triticum dicoccoides]|uniref:G-type lectin S-receptor-like serine/threonine-protein kinase SD2-5 n=1 Tax=Triticum dicoccoides TaxID=85692 RepID=UPI0018911A22|nr:G-type lectin S-receptor-like serine/threonine-protein kinase SD2-5 [Triticum dicoccoides]